MYSNHNDAAKVLEIGIIYAGVSLYTSPTTLGKVLSEANSPIHPV